jgi:S1-C subfamily serine protease
MADAEMSRFTELVSTSQLEKSTEAVSSSQLAIPAEQAMLVLPAIAHYGSIHTGSLQSPVVSLLQCLSPSEAL